MFESDCWLDWDPDPELAAREADPALEPYASMSKEQVLDLMAHAKGGHEWEFLQAYFLSKCTAEELGVGTEEFIRAQYGVFGFEELCFLEGAIELALQHRNRPNAEGRGPELEADKGRYPFPYQADPPRAPPSTPEPGREEIELPRPVAS